MTGKIAERVVGLCDRLRIPLIFKASYRKANRTRVDSFTGIGDEAALKFWHASEANFPSLLSPTSTKAMKPPGCPIC